MFQSDSLGLKFGTMGSGKEEPYDITIDNFAKQIFVTIRKLNQIQAFNMEDGFIFTDHHGWFTM